MEKLRKYHKTIDIIKEYDYIMFEEEKNMLVQFKLKNVLSFKDEAVLDMTAINAYKEHESSLIDIGTNERFLKVAAIYGANASGKTNLLAAMAFFQQIILESFNNIESGDQSVIEKYYIPFSFEPKPHGNSEFQMITIVDGYEYRYGFEYNSKCIEMEWLYRKNLNTNREITILEREGQTVNFGPSVRKECGLYKDQIQEGTLALSFLNKLNLKTDVFHTVFSEAENILIVNTSFLEDTKRLRTLLPKAIDRDKKKLDNFLCVIDSGFDSIRYDKDEGNNIRFTTNHKGKNGKRYSVDLFDESVGTVRSLLLFICIQNAVQKNSSIFIDDYNANLHPLIQKYLIGRFCNEKTNAQLVYTTHDTTLLDRKYVRRDQIWFVQKDKYGGSHLSSLSDFRVRSDASFGKDYLAGVYGGIPDIEEVISAQ